MAALRALTLAVLLVATPAAAAPSESDPVSRWRAEIAEASARFGVPVAWIERVMRAESGGQTMLRGRPITSRAGAMGLMQLMPATWAAMRATLSLGRDPHVPRDNILAGTAYLRAMYDRFGYPGLFAAYNASPGRYAAYLASGRPLPGETRAYLATVTGTVTGTPSGPPLPSLREPSPALFVALRTGGAPRKPSPSGAGTQASGSLFVSLSSDRPDR
ncbi:lytic transglycosylase domain-containing protein [Sphingomonas paucimobilis]|uniref:lytic transglycosylase domain-containing protein n=1 Tax=Sphingomonas paucimobilis TaxID=13689 RepID=UPI0028D7FC1A|nr:lytic transglycosylase domain-containing protein [Sphingomonas paucimobilis]